MPLGTRRLREEVEPGNDGWRRSMRAVVAGVFLLPVSIAALLRRCYAIGNNLPYNTKRLLVALLADFRFPVINAAGVMTAATCSMFTDISMLIIYNLFRLWAMVVDTAANRGDRAR